MKILKFILLLCLAATIQKVNVFLYGVSLLTHQNVEIMFFLKKTYIVLEYFYKIHYRLMSKMHQ